MRAGLGSLEAVDEATFEALADASDLKGHGIRGRARTRPEAILWHGGEAEAAQDACRRMMRSERDALVKCLESI